MTKFEEELSIQQQFLLSFFNEEPRKQILRVGKFVLVKSFNNDLNNWKVGIYTKRKWKIINKMKKIAS